LFFTTELYTVLKVYQKKKPLVKGVSASGNAQPELQTGNTFIPRYLL